MRKLNYYEISYSVDKKVTGSKDSQIINFIDPENNNPERMSTYSYVGLDHINPNLDFSKFKADGKAIMTDVLSSNFFSSYLIISERFKNFLEEFDLSNIRFLEITVTKNNEKYTYYIVSCIEDVEIVNFSQSTFIGDNSSPALRKGGDVIKTDSYDDYSKKATDIWYEKGFGFVLVPIKVALNYNSDMVKFPLGTGLLTSEKVKEKIEKEKLTGVVIQKSDIEFFLND